MKFLPWLHAIPLMVVGCSTNRAQPSNQTDAADTSEDGGVQSQPALIEGPTEYKATCLDSAHLSTHAVYKHGGADGGPLVQDGVSVCPCLDGSCLEGSPGDPWADAAPDAHPMPELPNVACESSDAASCELPKSFCLDDQWVGYYTNPRCVDDRCQWDIAYASCSGPCESGGCLASFTH
jgi:hypothetical protein